MSKIDNTFVDNAEDLDILMAMHNLLKYSTIIIWHQKICEIIIEMK